MALQSESLVEGLPFRPNNCSHRNMKFLSLFLFKVSKNLFFYKIFSIVICHHGCQISGPSPEIRAEQIPQNHVPGWMKAEIFCV